MHEPAQTADSTVLAFQIGYFLSLPVQIVNHLSGYLVTPAKGERSLRLIAGTNQAEPRFIIAQVAGSGTLSSRRPYLPPPVHRRLL